MTKVIETKENELYREISIIKDGICIGKAEINLENKMLCRFEIFKEYQNKGYGTEAIKHLKEKYGIDKLWVEADNHKAIHIYKKNGFEIKKVVMYLMESEGELKDVES